MKGKAATSYFIPGEKVTKGPKVSTLFMLGKSTPPPHPPVGVLADTEKSFVFISVSITAIFFF